MVITYKHFASWVYKTPLLSSSNITKDHLRWEILIYLFIRKSCQFARIISTERDLHLYDTGRYS